MYEPLATHTEGERCDTLTSMRSPQTTTSCFIIVAYQNCRRAKASPLARRRLLLAIRGKGWCLQTGQA